MKRQLRPALGLLGIGWFFATCIVLGVVGGLWLDGQLDSDPIFTLAGLLLGLAAAGWGVYRLLRDVLRAPKRP
ncbi:MAG: AtpZ/AtpI family protein [Dehalococcoidia bacterium]